jgi:tetratricopeptide (TPR) repeat protein
MKFWKVLGRIFSPFGPSRSPEENREAVEHYKRASAFHGAGKLDEAIGEFRAALRLEPGYIDARGNLANLLSDRGDKDAAILEYRELLRLNPADHLSHYNLGIALKTKGDLAGAISEFRAALKIDPRYSHARHNLGTTLLDSGDIDGAIKNLQAALDVNPSDFLTKTALDHALRVRDDPKKAAQHRLDFAMHPGFYTVWDSRDQTHIESEAQSRRSALSRDQNEYDAHGRVGDKLALQGNLKGAIIEWKAALRQLGPDSLHAPDLHNSVARALLQLGDVEGAIAESSAALLLDPETLPAQECLTEALSWRRDLAGAIEAFRVAVQLTREYSSLQLSVATLFEAAGDKQHALEHYHRTLMLNPGDARAKAAIARIRA